MKKIVKGIIHGISLGLFLNFIMSSLIDIIFRDMSQLEAVTNNILPLIFSIYWLLAVYVSVRIDGK